MASREIGTFYKYGIQDYTVEIVVSNRACDFIKLKRKVKREKNTRKLN